MVITAPLNEATMILRIVLDFMVGSSESRRNMKNEETAIMIPNPIVGTSVMIRLLNVVN